MRSNRLSYRPSKTRHRAATVPRGQAYARREEGVNRDEVDPETGVGTVHALARDLALERAARTAHSGRWALVALAIQSLDQVRLVLGEEPVRDMFRGLVEIAPFALHARDRLYRTGRDELSVLLPKAEDGAVEDARARLELALTTYLAGRGLPAITLVARVIDADMALPTGARGAPRSVAF